MKREVRQLLDLLDGVVSLPCSPPIKFAIALDWYKIPVDGVDHRDWPNTEIGELVHRGKYLYRTQEEQKGITGRNLAGRICNVISRHAVMNSAEVILNIPGHDRNVVSFGPRLAATVAKYLRIPNLRVTAKSEFRPEAKSLSPMERAMFFGDEFTVPTEIRGHSALIVDDVFRSGGSMAAVAKAAREAGAQEIFGICAARTMRR
ncbi:MAG TPA: phosphoribosyltransferase [Streptosporangiaceae bacterium]|nr:phosphoribosyltransferase [Streptosporangiaceae bacterium]